MRPRIAPVPFRRRNIDSSRHAFQSAPASTCPHLTPLPNKITIAGHLDLSGLSFLSEAATQALVNRSGPISLPYFDVAAMSVASRVNLARTRDFCPAGPSLAGVRQLSQADAASLAGYRGRLFLPDLENLPEPVAGVLAEHRGPLHFGEALTELSAGAAQVLSAHRGSLRFDGLTELPVAVAEALAKLEDRLSFPGLKRLPTATAEALATHHESLSLNGLIQLSDAAAAALAKHEGDLYLDNLSELTEQAAEALARHRGELSLGGLKEVSDGVAAALSRHQDLVYLSPGTTMSGAAAQVLAASMERLVSRKNGSHLLLKPAEQHRQRKASIEELDQLIAKPSNPLFVEVCIEFKAKLQEGDELGEFCTDEQSWDHLAGRAGFKITRNGETVAELVMMIN